MDGKLGWREGGRERKPQQQQQQQQQQMDLDFKSYFWRMSGVSESGLNRWRWRSMTWPGLRTWRSRRCRNSATTSRMRGRRPVFWPRARWLPPMDSSVSHRSSCLSAGISSSARSFKCPRIWKCQIMRRCQFCVPSIRGGCIGISALIAVRGIGLIRIIKPHTVAFGIAIDPYLEFSWGSENFRNDVLHIEL